MDSASKPALSAVEWVRNDKSKNIFERVLFEKTKPIYSFRVLCSAFCDNGIEKTKPIYAKVN